MSYRSPLTLRRSTLCIALAATLSTACVAPSADDDAESGSAAVQTNPAYDDAVRRGKTVTTDSHATAERSAETHLVGFLRGRDGEAVFGQLLSVSRWPEIVGPEGDRPFKRVVVVSDTTRGDIRTIAAKLTFDHSVTLDVTLTARRDGGAYDVIVVNNTAFRHWLAGTVLEPNRLAIQLRLVPYQGGLIVDATCRVKLKKMESKAADLTRSVESMFDWLSS